MLLMIRVTDCRAEKKNTGLVFQKGQKLMVKLFGWGKIIFN